MNNQNSISTIALIIALIVGTIYITREVSADRSMKLQVDRLQSNKDSLDKALKDLVSRTFEKDKAILEQIKISYNQIDLLANQKKDIHATVERQQQNLDSLINEIIRENGKYETQ
ncbi:MAG: hypothetical protein FGM41_07340 [Bacteroidetes bacterium]|nr:hypothetical protein [Bacteroidota bacterium]